MDRLEISHTYLYIHYVTMCEISSESLLQKKSYKMHCISHRQFKVGEGDTHNVLPAAWIDLKFHTHICISTMSLCVKFQVNPFCRKKVIKCIGFPIDIYSANTNPHNFLPAAWIDLKFHTHICISTMSLCVKFQVNPFCRKKVIKCIGFPIGNYHSQCKRGGA